MDRSLRRYGQMMVLVAALSGAVAGGALGLLQGVAPSRMVVAPAPAREATATAPSPRAGRSAAPPSTAPQAEVVSGPSAARRTPQPKAHDQVASGGKPDHGTVSKLGSARDKHQGKHKRD